MTPSHETKQETENETENETGAAAQMPDAAESRHRSIEELEAALAHIRAAPVGNGVIELIVRRPAVDAREVLSEARVSADEGIEGDGWRQRGSSKTVDGGPHPAKQITIMGTRAAAAIIGESQRWPLAGDQLYADLNLSLEALPPGTKLSVGDAVLEVSAEPHTGCAKFAARFGSDALRFVNTGEGRELRLRGVNCRVIQPGTTRTGDTITSL